jgi:peptidoglycan/LPS O-acetylase OafA/YrhL
MYAALKKRMTLILLVLSVISITFAIIIGISDNPPGILLCFLGCILFILSFSHSWRKPKPYLILLIISLLGFIVFVVLINIFGGRLSGAFFEIIGTLIFIVATMLFPVGIIIGGIGSLVTYYKKLK